MPLQDPQRRKISSLLDSFADISPRNSGLRRELLAFSCMLMVIASSCVRKSEEVAFVARVNHQYLTPEKVRASLDTTAHATDPQVRDFVTQWVNSALLYEEAKAQGLDRSAQVNETLEEMKKQLAVNRLLETELYANHQPSITDEEVRTYYDRHKDAYLLGEDLAKIRFVLFANRDAASRFRGQLMRGKSWDQTLQSLERDSSVRRSIVERADSQYVKRSTVRSMELWKAVTQLPVGELPQIVKDDAGYFVVSLLQMQRAGDVAELPSVASETRDRVLIEKRQKAFSEFLERLRKKYSVQLNLSALEGVDGVKAKE
jgi:peptidyl-prolyl cis-trans isomerase C